MRVMVALSKVYVAENIASLAYCSVCARLHYSQGALTAQKWRSKNRGSGSNVTGGLRDAELRQDGAGELVWVSHSMEFTTVVRHFIALCAMLQVAM